MPDLPAWPGHWAESSWSLGGSFLSLELPFSLIPDNDPFGTSQPPHEHLMVFGLCSPMTTAVGRWPALAILSSDMRDDNLMLQALSPPSSSASMPLQPSLNGAKLQHAQHPEADGSHRAPISQGLHLLSIWARGLGSLTLHLGEFGHSIFLTCCLHGSITKIFSVPHKALGTRHRPPHDTSVLSDPRERWNSQVQQASTAASHPPLQHMASSVPGSLTAPCPTGCPWVATSRREGRLNKRESARICSTKTLGQQH